jgi:hypothetical protein
VFVRVVSRKPEITRGYDTAPAVGGAESGRRDLSVEPRAVGEGRRQTSRYDKAPAEAGAESGRRDLNPRPPEPHLQRREASYNIE